MEADIPVINLQEIKGEESYERLREVCKKWGCFRVTNHGFPTNLMAVMKIVAEELFNLPMEIKMRNKEVVIGQGFMPPSEKFPLYEALGFFDSTSSHALSNFCSGLEASPHQREVMEVYIKENYKVVIDIASKIATSLGLADYSFEDWKLQFRMNKYNFSQEAVGSNGIRNHTDVTFLTLLQEDEIVGGLEVMNPSGSFVAVDPVPGTFIVNLGDLAVPWSNGHFRNPQHRVLCKGEGIRVSIVTFLAPEPNTMFEAHPKLLEPDRPPIFAPFTYADLRNMRFAENLHTGEALDRVRLRDQKNV